jgi:hypothetical protein
MQNGRKRKRERKMERERERERQHLSTRRTKCTMYVFDDQRATYES